MRRVTQAAAQAARARLPLRRSAAALLALLALGAADFAAAAPASAQAQTGTIAGTVLDRASGQPIAGASATLEGSALSAVSRSDGRFVLRGVPAGRRAVFVEAPGYVALRQEVTVAAGQTAAATFMMEVGVVMLDEIAVTRTGVPSQERMGAPGQVQFRAMDMARIAGMPGRFNTESYAHIDENDFRLVSASPLSTFSIDVDRASYANVRRFIQSGERPPVDAVRIEELVNYFPYEWGAVSGDRPFSVTTEVWEAPWKREHRLVRIGLHARSVDTENLPPSNLVFLIDVSGSMGMPDKLPLLKKAFALLVDQLRPQDRVAIAVYAGAAGLALESTAGDQRAEIMAALEGLHSGGSTAGGAGLALAYDVARRNRIDGGNNRVVLATDGDFNVGPSSDAEMVRLIERERESGTFLTVLGFGTGNLKDSKMEQIADHGNGNFHYVDGLLEARKVLIEEMGGTLLTLAKDVKLQVEFNPDRAAGYRLIGYENRLLAAEDFNDDAKDAGELGAGHTVTALYEVVPAGVEVPRGEVDPLRYQEPAAAQPPDNPPPSEFADELMHVKVRYKDPDGARSKLLEHAVADRPGSPSTDFRFAAAVAGFGMLLRDSGHAGDLALDDVVRLAEKGKGGDPRGYRGEFIRLVEAARDLGLLNEGNQQ